MPRLLRDSRGIQDTAGLDVSTSIEATKILNSIERPKGYTVSYHANPEVEGHHFGMAHPMKPWRLTLTNKLVVSYGMHDAMDLYTSRAATEQELLDFHTEKYVKELQ
jgi:histone deacetylase HOS2